MKKWTQICPNFGYVSWRSDFFIPKKYFSFEKIQKYFWDFFQNIFFNFWVDLFRKSYLPTFLLKYFEIMLKKYHFQKKNVSPKKSMKNFILLLIFEKDEIFQIRRAPGAPMNENLWDLTCRKTHKFKFWIKCHLSEIGRCPKAHERSVFLDGFQRR